MQPATQAGLMASGSRSCNAKACHALGLTCTSSSVMLAATLSHTCVSGHLLQEARESVSAAHRAAMSFSCLGLQSSIFDIISGGQAAGNITGMVEHDLLL